MKYLSVSVLLIAAGVAGAQDMPLHEILKPGETWQPTKAEMPATMSIDRAKNTVKEPTCCTLALGGSTLLVADTADRHVWAFRIEKDGTLGPGDRYCRLQVRGDQRKTKTTPPEDYRADPSAMTIDGMNRTYVATNLGIQVFDPTGRLCGVFTSPPGRVTALSFDGDRLFAQADNKTFVRTMLAEGRK
ncbi:MAG TPA: SMP-30/gluconolactonase/LRE family protein [Gemmataceae bacterium]|jgi:enterochelin esterase family protein|nr:SMP-30/gluconolactonase/LRE family protein [Gemmataceae bacterium]